MQANLFTKNLWLDIFLFVISIVALNVFKSGSSPFMFFAGVFMTHYALLGLMITTEYWKSLTIGGLSLQLLEPDKSLRIFVVVGSIVITCIALLVWVAEGLGDTGPFYHVGALLGGIAFHCGIGDMLKNYLQQYRVTI